MIIQVFQNLLQITSRHFCLLPELHCHRKYEMIFQFFFFCLQYFPQPRTVFNGVCRKKAYFLGNNQIKYRAIAT